MNSADILRILLGAGWREVGRKGSHVQLKHPLHKGRVTVPHPTKDIPIGTVKSIERQSDMVLIKRR